MKGPGLRLLVDVRRAWKCPRCGYEERVGAEVTSVACPCCPGVGMKLIEQKRVYADELRKLRERPQPVTDESFNGGADAIISVAEHIEEAPPTVVSTDAAANTTGDVQAPQKRRGKRPHKQSRREQHRVQQQSAAQASDSEE